MNRRALRLAPFLLLAVLALLLAGTTGWLLRERITANQADTLGRALRAVAPPGMDNDPGAERKSRSTPYGTATLYPVRHAGRLNGWVCRITTPEGYNGSIELLAGIGRNGEPTGVRILRHRETPGIGGSLLREGSPWLRQWRDRAEGLPDTVSGATITTRAVRRAVEQCLVLARPVRTGNDG